MPRDLSFTVRPWRRDLYLDLVGRGHAYAQLDLNLLFWRTLLAGGEEDLIGRLVDARYQSGAANRGLLAECEQRSQRFQLDGATVDLRGLHLDEAISTDSARLLAWTESDATRHF
ncbi:MAG: hypothetical protein H7322_11555, partial [Ramlibacter sp.]|nr:hypothetical protein [Ramlibacter sp.]